MNSFKSLILVLLVAVVSSEADETTPAYGIRTKDPAITAFTNATIQISPVQIIEKGTLVVRDGLIEAVGQKVTIPADATVIDLSGKFIYPGFIDPYAEYGLGKKEKPARGGRRDSPPKYEATRVGGNAWNEAIHAATRHIFSFEPDQKQAEEFHKSGFTAVQSAKFDGIFRGRSFVTLLGEGIPNDLVLRPHSLHFMSFDKGSSEQQYPGSLMGSIALIRQTFLDTDWYQKARGALALNPNQEMPEYNHACEALAEAVNNNESFVFETGDKLTLLRANRIAREFGRTFVNVGYGDEYQRIKEIAADKQILIVPLNYPETPNVGSYEDQLDVTLGALRHWEMAPSNPAILEKNKIEFAFTTYRLDKKENFLENLRKAVKRGLSKETALAALTSVPARICGISDLTGTLTQGKLANLFITDKEIFDKEATIYSVWVAGKKNEIKPFPEHDFVGTYGINIDGVKLDLDISGKPDKPSGKLEVGEKKYDLTGVELQGAKLLFSAKFDTLGLDGVYRFSGRKIEKNIQGKVTRPDGTRLDFAAPPIEKKKDASKDTSDVKKEDGKDKDEKESDEPETLVSKLTYPNIAFGFETLPKQQDVLVKNATVWTGEKEGILPNSDVLVVGGKIAAVGKGLTPPKNGKVIDAAGKHLTAGIIDEHSHIAINGGVNECSDAITCEVRIGDVVDCDDNSIYRQLAGGTTAAQLLHGSCNPIGGQAQVIKLRWGSNSEEMKFSGAPASVKFALGENVKQSNWGDNYSIRYPQTRMGVETLIKDEFQAAKEYDAKWAEYNSLSSGNKRKIVPPRRDLELDAASDIMNSKMFIHCHSYHQSEILMLMRLTEQFGFHVQTFTHILEGYKLAPEMAKHGATASGFADWWAYKFEVYDAIPYNSVLMASAGVVTSINSDSDDLGRRLNQEAAKAVMYGGMSQEEAIKLATLNPAIQLKIDDRVGSIKVGKDADFVIWDNHPLSIYAKPEQTWIDGKKYFDIQDDLAMRKTLQSEKEALVQKVLAKSDGKKKGDGKWGERTNTRKYEWHCDDGIDFWKAVQQ